MSKRVGRASDPERTRQRLIEAARTVYEERGFLGSTVAEIASRAGMTTGALYANFKGKADLFTVLLEERSVRLRANVRAALDAGQTVRDSVLNVVALYRRLSVDDPLGSRLTRDLVCNATLDGDVRARVAALYEGAIEDVAAELRAGLPSPWSDEAEALSRLSVAVIEGSLLQEHMYGDQRAFDALERVIMLVLPAG